MKPITVEELNAINPSLENPVELECFDGYYIGDLSKIKVVSPIIKNSFFMLDRCGDANTFRQEALVHFTLKKPEQKIEILYECVDNFGTCVYFFEDGSYPYFCTKAKSPYKKFDALKRKTGRTLKINIETFEIVGE